MGVLAVCLPLSLGGFVVFALCALVLFIDESAKGAAEDSAGFFHLLGVMPEVLAVRRVGHWSASSE